MQPHLSSWQNLLFSLWPAWKHQGQHQSCWANTYSCEKPTNSQKADSVSVVVFVLADNRPLQSAHSPPPLLVASGFYLLPILTILVASICEDTNIYLWYQSAARTIWYWYRGHAWTPTSECAMWVAPCSLTSSVSASRPLLGMWGRIWKSRAGAASCREDPDSWCLIAGWEGGGHPISVCAFPHFLTEGNHGGASRADTDSLIGGRRRETHQLQASPPAQAPPLLTRWWPSSLFFSEQNQGLSLQLFITVFHSKRELWNINRGASSIERKIIPVKVRPSKLHFWTLSSQNPGYWQRPWKLWERETFHKITNISKPYL